MTLAPHKFSGIYVAIATPFSENGDIDHGQLAKLSDDLIERGVHGLVPCGTTGESTTLSHKEHIEVVKTVIDAAKGRVPIIAGTGSNSTSEAMNLTKAARETGADGALSVVPYYNKPSQEGLYQHFAYLADQVGLPTILYNIPGRTSANMDPDTIARLARLESIVGLKEATGNITVCTDIRLRVDKSFAIFAGDDAMTLPMMSVGGDGVISVVAQVYPEKMVELWDCWQAGDTAKARIIHQQLTPLIQAMFVETNPAPVKEALFMIGAIGSHTLRLPLVRISHTSRAVVREALSALGLEPIH